MNNYQNLSGKTEKISQYCVGSAPPFYFGTGHVTVLSAPPWKMEYSGGRLDLAVLFTPSTPNRQNRNQVHWNTCAVLPVRSGRSKENS